MSGPPPPSKPTPRERELHALASRYEERIDDRETVISVVGDASRTGPWLPPEETLAVAGFGNVKLDFTEAELPAGVTDVTAWAVFGTVEIRVPQGLEVELDGVALLGNLVHRTGGGDTRERLKSWLGMPERRPDAPRPDIEAVLSVRGTAIFGDIVVQVV